MKRRVHLKALGCKTNQYENDALAAAFVARGYEVTDTDADVVVLNTCAVTAEAGRKSRQAARRLRRRFPNAVLVVAGCLPALEASDGLADLVIGTHGRDRLVDRVDAWFDDRASASPPEPSFVALPQVSSRFETIAPVATPSDTRAWIKVEDGCAYACTYCAIRLARGPVRSRPWREVVHEIETLRDRGVFEFVLTGTQIGAYGSDTGEGTWIDLLERLNAIDGVRLRLGSIDPRAFASDSVRRLTALTRVCPHLHLSLQSGSDSVLRRMGRGYDSQMYRALVEHVFERWPQAGLTTDVMVAFPGESEADHRASCAFIDSLAFTDLHVFRYSRRPGTVADRMGGFVPASVARRRAAELEALAADKRTQALAARLGARRTIVVETVEDGIAQGISEDYLRLHAPVVTAEIGARLDVRICGGTGERMDAVLASKNDATRRHL